jgi:hypothetical protein
MKIYEKTHVSNEVMKSHISKIIKRGGKYYYRGKTLYYSFDNDLKLKDLIGERYLFHIGNSEEGIREIDKEFIEEQMLEALYHAYFPDEVYHNLTSGDESISFRNKFITNVIKHKLKNFDKTLNEIFWLEEDKYRGYKVVFLSKELEQEQWQDNYMLNSDFIEKSLRKKYIAWRKEYSGAILKQD